MSKAGRPAKPRNQILGQPLRRSFYGDIPEARRDDEALDSSNLNDLAGSITPVEPISPKLSPKLAAKLSPKSSVAESNPVDASAVSSLPPSSTPPKAEELTQSDSVAKPAVLVRDGRRFRWVYGLYALLGLSLALLAGFFIMPEPTSTSASQPFSTPLSTPLFTQAQVAQTQSPVSPGSVNPTGASNPANAAISVRAANPVQASSETLLGHFPYAEAPAETLRSLSSNASIKLRAAAADKFEAMMAAAQQDGVQLVALSGFRSQSEQNYLFFDVKAQEGETARQRAEVSAPPGYSEHHTGYAVDVADGSRQDTDLQTAFETTPTFNWLKANAARFSFELSFPRDNPQGISYEPWHWRFVGDRDSLETFYKVRPTPSTTNAPVNPTSSSSVNPLVNPSGNPSGNPSNNSSAKP